MIKERRWVFSDDSKVVLRGFFSDAAVPSGEGLPAVIVLPGGGYLGLSETEGAPVAQWFAENGYRAFVLEYSTAYGSFEKTDGEMNPSVHFPGPVYNLAAAVMLLRENAKDLDVNPDRIALCGFSAGGHLAAHFCNCWPEAAEELGVKPALIQPNADILCYAVTDIRAEAKEPIEKQMYTAIFGTDTPRTESREALSPVVNVNLNTPPTFLWHSAMDRMVSAVESMSMAAALAAQGTAYELHIFDKGVHADGLSPGMPAQIWPQLADRFLGRHMR